MDVQKVLHMNGGFGDNSYAKNSQLQSKMITLTAPIIQETIVDFYRGVFPGSIGIADLGCSSGPNTLLALWGIIKAIENQCSRLHCSLPEFRVFLNDLVGNDFNSIFNLLPAFQEKLEKDVGIASGTCLFAGVPGSFYGRLFPKKSLQFVHSSSSLHWLSQVPPVLDAKARVPINKGKIYISRTSPSSVLKAYLAQFEDDFTSFLRSRSMEVDDGGRMVLSFIGRVSADPTTIENCHQWELLAQALNDMALEGLVEKEKIDSFNIPYYSPSSKELKSVIQREGSFVLNRLEAQEVEWDAAETDHRNNFITSTDTSAPRQVIKLKRGEYVGKVIRAVVESMLKSHFGEEIIDDLFRRYIDIVDGYLCGEKRKYTNFVLSLTKI